MQNPDFWHSQPADEVATTLNADVTEGLATNEIAERLARYGPNKPTEHKGDGPIKRFLLQFHQPLVYILLAAAGVTLALQEWVDTAVIIAVVIVNAVIGFIQEARALQAISALSGSLQTKVIVIRAGKREPIAAGDLVPGDLVVLQAGDKVSADMRLPSCRY